MRYNEVQEEQLLEQCYIDTEDVRILIVCSGRHTVLDESLRAQVHHNFTRLYLKTGYNKNKVGFIHWLDELIDIPWDGILFLNEDCFLMSIALMLYADAIREGSDFITSDVSFGCDGVIRTYWREPSHVPSYVIPGGTAVLSRELLKKFSIE